MGHVELEPDYLEPLDEDETIYRYMDFAKFASLLHTGELHFHQAADFDDNFEGSVPDIIEAAREREYQEAAERGDIREDGHQVHAEINKFLRRFTYLSCWHMTDEESVAMWKQYGGSDRAVAIKTTVGGFHNALNADSDHDIYFAEVNYRPYRDEHDSTPDIDDIDLDELDDRFFITRNAHSLVPFIYKREAFSYENEMRAIIQEPPADPELEQTIVEIDGEPKDVDFRILTEDGPQYVDTRIENPNKGINVSVILDALIDTVHIAPEAAGWFKKTVKKEIENCEVLMDEHESEDIVEDSILDEGIDPTF